MKIGEVAKRTGCNIETIRYYERIGVIDAPPRRGAYRDYGPHDTERLRFIRRARELGFSLEEVRALLDLTPGQEVRCDEVQSIAEQHLVQRAGRFMGFGLGDLSQSGHGCSFARRRRVPCLPDVYTTRSV